MAKKNREEYNEYMREYLLNRYHERMAKARDGLGGVCCKCGSTENLELDHIDPFTKSGTMAKIWSYSEEAFEEELKKCQLLCRDCHTEKTIKEQGLERAKHGTLTMYKEYKCRCSECVEANRIYTSEYRKRKKQEDPFYRRKKPD